MAIRAYFKAGEVDITVNGLYQWDKDQTLIINDYTLPSSVEVHFACSGMTEAKCEKCSCVAGCISASIPDKCLEQTTPVIAWVCDPTSHGTQTLRTIVMPIIPRTKPGDVEASQATVTDKIVGLSMASGDQIIQAETGTTMDRVTITKPATLTPANIKEGVTIGGVVGTFKPSQVAADIREKSVNIVDNGSYTINPPTGADGMSKLNLNVKVPALLVDAKLQEKTVTMNGEYGADSGYDGLSKVIVNIPTDRPVNNQNKTITATTERQTINADSGYDGLGTVTIEAVTRDIDDNIKPSNIKKDVEILGVVGTFDAGSVEFNTQDKTVTATTETQDIVPDEGFDGLSSVTVKAVTNAIDENIKAENIKKGVSILGIEGTIDFTKQAKTATPTTAEQVITPDANIDGLSSVTISAVTSAIDESIKPENIKSGVSILGVEGSITFTTQAKTATPTTKQQVITPDQTADGLSSVTISAVTSSIDSNIAAGNIKKGVSILGVAGSYEFSKQNKTVTATTSTQTITAAEGYDGLGTVTVNPVTSAIDSNIAAGNIKKGVSILGVAGSLEYKSQTKTITPTTSAQTVTPDSGYNGLGTVTVNPVTSTIDSNITASNIKKGVSILGVAGSLEYKSQTKTVAPTTSAQTVTPDSGYNGLSRVTVSAVTSSIDSNITPANIKAGASILGVSGTCPTFYTVSSVEEMEALSVPAGTLAIISEA